MPIVLLSTLTACGVSIGSTEAPILVDPPIGLLESCERPVVLPDHGLTQAEVEAFWIMDRENLVRCDLQLKELIDFYSTRDKGIKT